MDIELFNSISNLRDLLINANIIVSSLEDLDLFYVQDMTELLYATVFNTRYDPSEALELDANDLQDDHIWEFINRLNDNNDAIVSTTVYTRDMIHNLKNMLKRYPILGTEDTSFVSEGGTETD